MTINKIVLTAKVGGWKLDPKTYKLIRTKQIYTKFEIDEDFEPTVKKAINFYYKSPKQIA